jgi:hypothetical protein
VLPARTSLPGPDFLGWSCGSRWGKHVWTREHAGSGTLSRPQSWRPRGFFHNARRNARDPPTPAACEQPNSLTRFFGSSIEMQVGMTRRTKVPSYCLPIAGRSNASESSNCRLWPPSAGVARARSGQNKQSGGANVKVPKEKLEKPKRKRNKKKVGG